jgi:hypothetical protein
VAVDVISLRDFWKRPEISQALANLRLVKMKMKVGLESDEGELNRKF